MPDAVTQWFVAHDEHDADLLIPTLHPDVQVRSLFRAEPAVGHELARAHFEGMMRTFPDLAMPITAWGYDEHPQVFFAEIHFIGTFHGPFVVDGVQHEGNQQTFDVTGVVCQHLRDGLIATTRTLFDRSEWLRQIGITDSS